MKYLIEVVKGRTKWRWRLCHKNGHILAHSEDYSSRFKARQTASQLFKQFKRGTCTISLG
jgi:uncharacterized protein YegP (UPF0339 family)